MTKKKTTTKPSNAKKRTGEEATYDPTRLVVIIQQQNPNAPDDYAFTFIEKLLAIGTSTTLGQIRALAEEYWEFKSDAVFVDGFVEPLEACGLISLSGVSAEPPTPEPEPTAAPSAPRRARRKREPTPPSTT
jgi:hypothetical protein